MHGASPLTGKQAILHEKRRIHAKRKRIFFIILFFILVGLFFYTIRKPWLRYNTVNVSGDTLVELDEIKSFVENKISGYKLFILPRNSIIFLKKIDLEKDVLNQFPRLSSALITGSKELNIAVGEPIFESMYCGISAESNLPINCVLLHPDGKISSTAPLYSHSPFFTFYKKTETLPETGSRILGIDEIERITLLRREVESYNIPVAGFLYGDDYDEILIDTGSEFNKLPKIRILFGATNINIGKTLGIAAKNEGVKKILIDDINNLDYIDLRFNEQVVYKKKSD